MIPLKILPMAPLVANGTIGNQRTLNVSRQPMVPLVPKGTIGGNVGTNGTIGSPNETIGKPNGVNSNIIINPSNILLYFSFSMCIVQCFYYLLISF